MPSLGPMELIIILAIFVLLFGGKKIAELGKGVGQGIRGFKSGLKDLNDAEAEMDGGDLPPIPAKKRLDPVAAPRKSRKGS